MDLRTDQTCLCRGNCTKSKTRSVELVFCSQTQPTEQVCQLNCPCCGVLYSAPIVRTFFSCCLPLPSYLESFLNFGFSLKSRAYELELDILHLFKFHWDNNFSPLKFVVGVFTFMPKGKNKKILALSKVSLPASTGLCPVSLFYLSTHGMRRPRHCSRYEDT